MGKDYFDRHTLFIINRVRRNGVEPTVTHLLKGPEHLEYHYYEHLVMDDMLKEIRKTETKGFHVAIIGCLYDPSLREAREG